MHADNKTIRLQGWAIAVLRMVTGYLFLVSGIYKVFIQNPYELNALLPAYMATALSLGELVCGAALVVGLLTRWVSAPLALLMLADILEFHPPESFFEQDHGYEYALLRLGASVALALAGSNKLALDNVLSIRRRPK
jgi:putative oxidoreductase